MTQLHCNNPLCKHFYQTLSRYGICNKGVISVQEIRKDCRISKIITTKNEIDPPESKYKDTINTIVVVDSRGLHWITGVMTRIGTHIELLMEGEEW